MPAEARTSTQRRGWSRENAVSKQATCRPAERCTRGVERSKRWRLVQRRERHEVLERHPHRVVDDGGAPEAGAPVYDPVTDCLHVLERGEPVWQLVRILIRRGEILSSSSWSCDPSKRSFTLLEPALTRPEQMLGSRSRRARKSHRSRTDRSVLGLAFRFGCEVGLGREIGIVALACCDDAVGAGLCAVVCRARGRLLHARGHVGRVGGSGASWRRRPMRGRVRVLRRLVSRRPCRGIGGGVAVARGHRVKRRGAWSVLAASRLSPAIHRDRTSRYARGSPPFATFGFQTDFEPTGRVPHGAAATPGVGPGLTRSNRPREILRPSYASVGEPGF